MEISSVDVSQELTYLFAQSFRLNVVRDVCVQGQIFFRIAARR